MEVPKLRTGCVTKLRKFGTCKSIFCTHGGPSGGLVYRPTYQ